VNKAAMHRYCFISCFSR